ncbi:MAG: hypothetical protein Fur0016_11360 [Anaerolineales bacterium]
MNPDDVRFYRDRWKAVEEIERQELRALTTEKRWKQINELARFAREHGLARGNDDGEIEVFRRWAKLKVIYDSKRQ